MVLTAQRRKRRPTISRHRNKAHRLPFEVLTQHCAPQLLLMCRRSAPQQLVVAVRCCCDAALVVCCMYSKPSSPPSELAHAQNQQVDRSLPQCEQAAEHRAKLLAEPAPRASDREREPVIGGAFQPSAAPAERRPGTFVPRALRGDAPPAAPAADDRDTWTRREAVRPVSLA